MKKSEMLVERGNNELTIEVERDAHDDTYYRVLQGEYIVAERVNGLDNLMMLVKAKVKSMDGGGC